jgi:exonuclease III
MTTLRILTYNIDGGRAEQVDALYEVLAYCRPDVAALNEADNQETIAALADRLGMVYVWARGSGDRHVATLSRFPILEWQIYNRKPLTQAALETVVDYQPASGNRPLTLYNLHLRPDPLWHYELMRWLAAGKLLSIIGRRPAGPCLILGDLNSYGLGDPLELEVILRYTSPRYRRILAWQGYRIWRLALPRLLRAGYTDCFRQVHPGEPGYTFTRHHIPVTRVDYILANREMTPGLRYCAPVMAVPTASDHFPLLAEFEIDEA